MVLATCRSFFFCPNQMLFPVCAIFQFSNADVYDKCGVRTYTHTNCSIPKLPVITDKTSARWIFAPLRLCMPAIVDVFVVLFNWLASTASAVAAAFMLFIFSAQFCDQQVPKSGSNSGQSIKYCTDIRWRWQWQR